MYTNNAYLNNSTIDRKDKSKPLVITMCGTYKLYTRPKLPTWRPRGRLDFQLLYIAAGKAHFHFDNNDEETIVHAGHMVLYRPKEPQKYEYYAKDQTEVYWVHFTGNGFDNIDGANYDLALWVAYYNFLRPHKHAGCKVLNKVEMLEGAENMPGKWQLLIFLGQQTILNLQNQASA